MPVKPQLRDMTTFWRPGNLNLARRRASWADGRLDSRQRMDMSTWPMLTRADTPMGLPKAPRIPVWSLSAPAHVSILLWRSTWKGCTRTRRWKASFPPFCNDAGSTKLTRQEIL